MMFCTKRFEGSSCRLIRLKAKARWLVSSGIIQQNRTMLMWVLDLIHGSGNMFTVAMRLKSYFFGKSR